MFIKIIFSTLFSIIFTLPIMVTPLTLGVWVLLLAIFIASVTTFFSSSWFGLLLFIIYIGGMLVIFSYFVAIAPNQKLPISIIFSLFFILFLIIYQILEHSSLLLSTTPSHPNSLITSITQIFEIANIPVLIFLAWLLLLALILVVKLASPTIGPLRPF